MVDIRTPIHVLGACTTIRSVEWRESTSHRNSTLECTLLALFSAIHIGFPPQHTAGGDAATVGVSAPLSRRWNRPTQAAQPPFAACRYRRPSSCPRPTPPRRPGRASLCNPRQNDNCAAGCSQMRSVAEAAPRRSSGPRTLGVGEADAADNHGDEHDVQDDRASTGAGVCRRALPGGGAADGGRRTLLRVDGLL